MTNAELIKALRCKSNNINDCTMCAYRNACYGGTLAEIAADALEEDEQRIAKLEAAPLPKVGEWIMDENPHDGDCRCSACLIAIDAMHERNHELLNALTGGKWWTFYRYCPNCGARMQTVTECHTLEEGER